MDGILQTPNASRPNQVSMASLAGRVWKSWPASDTCMLLTRHPCPLPPCRAKKKQLPGRDSAYLTVQIAATGTPHHIPQPSGRVQGGRAALPFVGPGPWAEPGGAAGPAGYSQVHAQSWDSVPKDCPWWRHAVFVEPTPALSIHPSLCLLVTLLGVPLLLARCMPISDSSFWSLLSLLLLSCVSSSSLPSQGTTGCTIGPSLVPRLCPPPRVRYIVRPQQTSTLWPAAPPSTLRFRPRQCCA